MIKLESFLEKPLSKFILWFLTGLFIVFFGVLNVKADTYNATQFSAQLYDNYGPNLSAVTTDFTNNRYQGIIPTMVANSAGAAWGISSPIGLLANHTYTMTIEITGTYGGRLVLSTFNRIGVGTTLQNAINSYQNNSYADEVYSKVLDNGITIQFAFTPSINSSYIVFPFATSYSGNTQYFYLTNVIIDDLGSEGVTQDEINNSLNSQTNVIQNSINNIENNIIENQNNIFTCTNLWNPETQILYSDGHWVYQTINIPKDGIYYFKSNLPNILAGEVYAVPHSMYLSAGPNVIYFGDVNNVIDVNNAKIMLSASDVPYCKYGQNKIDETNNQLEDLNDNITNSNVDNDNVSSSFEDFNSFLDDNSTITKLVTLPITLYTAILNNVNGTCTPFNLGDLYGVNLSLPCVNIGNYLGPVLWGMIDIIISGFAVYYIAKKLVKVFNNVSSMKEGDVIDD